MTESMQVVMYALHIAFHVTLHTKIWRCKYSCAQATWLDPWSFTMQIWLQVDFFNACLKKKNIMYFIGSIYKGSEFSHSVRQTAHLALRNRAGMLLRKGNVRHAWGFKWYGMSACLLLFHLKVWRCRSFAKIQTLDAHASNSPTCPQAH